LPDGQIFVETAKSQLQIPKSYWTNAQFGQRDFDTLTKLRKTNWVVRIFYPVVKRKVDKRNARLQ
jgi:hypothetical protein